MNKKIFIILIIAITIIVLIFILILATRGPNSPLVHIFGQSVANFQEYEKIGDVSIADIEISAVVYYKKTYDSYTMAGAEGDESYLVAKDLRTGSEQLVFAGNLGHDIKYVFVDVEKQRLYYTLNDARKAFNVFYLVVYDLIEMRELKKIIAIDTSIYKDDSLFLGGWGYIAKTIYDEASEKISFQVSYRTDDNYYDGAAYFSLDPDTEEVLEITKEMYDTYDNGYINKYAMPVTEKRLFEINSPNQSEYLIANYKPKYNGIYVWDGHDNIRLTKNEKQYFIWKSLWLNDGQYVINGSYLYDASGKKHELKIADGDVLAVY